MVRIRFESRFPEPPYAGHSARAGAARLLSLLQAHPSYRFLAGEGATGVLIIVRFSYHSAVELSRLYDQLLWLLEISSRSGA